MLKNKKAVYILIPLNVFIWGFFIYRFYSAYNAEEPNMETMPKIAGVQEKLTDSTIYALSLDYRDPFLKANEISHRSEPIINKESLPQPKPITVKTPSVQMPKPDIKFLGLIKNTSNGQATALITLNGQSRLIKSNDAFEGVVFKTFNSDSLVARWGKEKIVVRK